MNGAYYNENDLYCAEWLRNLIAKGHIAPGEVDTRSICDVAPDDVRGFTQVHLFAGIGGWPYALRLADWPDDRPVWTGSCPCQPFSAAGKRKGAADERHLWPEMYRLIAACKPERIFGEQVEAAVRLGWIDGVFADLAREGYACGFAVLGAHSVGAPHIRQRIYWMADAGRSGLRLREHRSLDEAPRGLEGEVGDQRVWSNVGNVSTVDGRMGDADAARSQGRRERPDERTDQRTPWASGIFIPCADGKARRVEPGIQPLVAGLPVCLARVRAIEIEAREKINASTGEADTAKAMRVVREIISTSEGGPGQSTRVRQQLPSAEILLAFLFCVETTRDGSPIESSLSEAGNAAQRRVLHSVWPSDGDGGSSRGREPNEQRPAESTDPVRLLPLVLARAASSYRQALLDAHAAAGRIGMLRAAGNAIVPQVAAEFIRASFGIS